VRFDSHGKELLRYIAELELGTTYGPTTGIRLVAATLDPRQLNPESTWYLATSWPMAQVSAEQVYEIYRVRDWTRALLQAGQTRVGLGGLPDAARASDRTPLAAGNAGLYL
jgi:hypothetical protein